jgi:hypothetical protein
MGTALAHSYAEPGRIVMLHGRNPERFAALAGSCEARGVTVHSMTFDLRAPDASFRGRIGDFGTNLHAPDASTRTRQGPSGLMRIADPAHASDGLAAFIEVSLIKASGTEMAAFEPPMGRCHVDWRNHFFSSCWT